MNTFRYDLAISFAGEDREFAQFIADSLKADIRIFYDKYESADLWGADLSQELPDRYINSRYCLIIQSHEYMEKIWTTLERQAMIFEFLKRRGANYLLPVRVRGCTSEIPGISGLTGYQVVNSREEWPDIINALKIKISSTA